MLVINPKRKRVFEHQGVKVTFDFVCYENRDLAFMRKCLESVPVLNDDEELKNSSEFQEASKLITLQAIRKSLVSIEGAVNPDGTPFQITDEESQKSAFEAVWGIDELRDAVEASYYGLDLKNLESGATQESTGDGAQKNVPSAGQSDTVS
jgi:hypothetical protein